jgi:hypothetical protein
MPAIAIACAGADLPVGRAFEVSVLAAGLFLPISPMRSTFKRLRRAPSTISTVSHRVAYFSLHAPLANRLVFRHLRWIIILDRVRGGQNAPNWLPDGFKGCLLPINRIEDPGR